MNITEFIDSACLCLKDQCLTDSTIYINYRRYWNGFLKSTDADTEFDFQIISDYLIRKYGRNLLLEEPSALPLKEYRIRHAFQSLSYFYNFQSMPGTSMVSAIVRIKLSEFDNLCLNSYIDHIKDLDYSQNSLKYGYNTIHNYLVAYPLADICDSHLLDYFKSLFRLSKQTARSMMKVLKLFLCYCHEMDIETERKVSVATRNHRRAGLVAFLAFASEVNPVYANAYIDAKKIKNKKAPKPKKDFLTVEEYQAMLESIDISTDTGFKHYILINVMYDTAARVDETVRMNMEDFSFGKENSVLIFGKGSKYRRIYLTKHTVKLIKEYSRKFNLENGAMFKNYCGDRISDSGIDYILKKYAKTASTKEKTLGNKTVSPHILRRSKATHMLLNGASLPIIQRFLGHESIQTTEAYLEIGSEAMTKAVEEAGKLIFKDTPEETVSSWKDPDILRRLKVMVK